jgi:hypothetical protein
VPPRSAGRRGRAWRGRWPLGRRWPAVAGS